MKKVPENKDEKQGRLGLLPVETAPSPVPAKKSRTETTRSAEDPLHYHGHRKRLRERFLRGGGQQLADYELLELLLFLVVGRQDVKPVAKALMEQFNNSFAVLLNASPDNLRTVKGVGDTIVTAIKIMSSITERASFDAAREGPIIGAWDQLLAYLRIKVGFAPVEHVRLLLLDSNNRLIRDEEHQVGTIDQASIFPQEVIRRAIELHATALVIVHNHPSGDPTPSRADIEMTKQISASCKVVGLSLYDHLIISKNKHYSMRAHYIDFFR